MNEELSKSHPSIMEFKELISSWEKEQKYIVCQRMRDILIKRRLLTKQADIIIQHFLESK